MVWFGDTDKDWMGAECFILGGAWGETAQGRSGQKGWAREEREDRRVVTQTHRGPGVMVRGDVSVIIKQMGDIRIA